MAALTPPIMKHILLAGIVLLTLTTSCADDSIWADDLPNRHDLVRWELEENLALATQDYDLYGIMIIGRHPDTFADTVIVQCRDKYIESEGITEDVEVVVDQNRLWIYRTVYYPDGNVRTFRLEWLYHNTGSSRTEYYRHEPIHEDLNESLVTLSISIRTSIDLERPENENILRHWKEI